MAGVACVVRRASRHYACSLRGVEQEARRDETNWNSSITFQWNGATWIVEILLFFSFFFLFFIGTHWTCEYDIGVVSKWHTRDLTMMRGRRFFAYWHYVLYVPANSNRVPAWVSWYIGLRVCRLTRSVAPPRKPDDTPVTISIHNPSSVPILATHCDPHDNARPLHPEGNVSYQTVRIHAFLNTFMWVCVCVYTLTRRLVTCMRRGRSESNRETTRRLRRRSAVKGSPTESVSFGWIEYLADKFAGSKKAGPE